MMEVMQATEGAYEIITDDEYAIHLDRHMIAVLLQRLADYGVLTIGGPPGLPCLDIDGLHLPVFGPHKWTQHPA